MTVLVEAYVLEDRPTGVGRFLGNILDVWSGWDPRPEIVLLGRTRPAPGWQHLARAFTWETIPARRPSFVLWQQGPVRRWLLRHAPQTAVYLAPNYTVPLRVPVPRVLIIHDVSFFRFPDWFDWRMRWIKRNLIRRSLREAVALLVPSQFTRSELHDLRPDVRFKPIHVVHEGWDPRLAMAPPIPAQRLRRQYEVPAEAFLFLYVGSIFRRRRMNLVLRAWYELARRRKSADMPHLVVIGENRSHPYVDYPRMTRHYRLDRWIHWLGYQAEAVVHSFYHAADAVLYLSEYEGFGLPILEGLAAGKPVVTADIPVVRELYGDAVYRTPLQWQPLVATLERVMADPRPGPGATDIVRAMTWETTARRIWQVLHHLRDAPGPA